jgi:hypothetical protein
MLLHDFYVITGLTKTEKGIKMLFNICLENAVQKKKKILSLLAAGLFSRRWPISVQRALAA